MTTFRYLRRFSMRPLMWLIRLVIVAGCVGALTWLIPYTEIAGMVVFVGIYGIWEIGRSIRSITPLNVNIARGETLIVESGASVSIPAADIDRVIETIGRYEAEKRSGIAA
ncbi:hypothetical protein [Devosia alba]|uniref:hypothetical protein n=1 Tax=Devosia alba TaxID=3152360 RepID=UPI00326579AC